MNYDIETFTRLIKMLLFRNMPFMVGEYNGQTKEQKHPNTPQHMREIALGKNPIIMVDSNIYTFDLGNEEAERLYPYYHILQDSPVIHKRGKSTEESRGSQQYVSNRGKRDYTITSFNGKTFSKEYEKNVRGARRSVIDNSTQFINGKKINRSSPTYKNIHYKYIDRILDSDIIGVAENVGLKYMGRNNKSLAEEYVSENYDIGIMGYDDTYDLVGKLLQL